MSTTNLIGSSPLKKGTYCPARPTDIRSPCPMINALANHGYLPRDGRNVLASELISGMGKVGLTRLPASVMVHTLYEAHVPESQQPKRNLFQKLWLLLTHPFKFVSKLGVRRADQRDSVGRKVIDLNQIGMPSVVEHNISLTRRDFEETGDNLKAQPEMIKALLATSSDGKVITTEELVSLRRKRTEMQLRSNHRLTYGWTHHFIACGEMALLMNILGDGQKVNVDYVDALFSEERLPREEGWRKPGWWNSVGLYGLISLTNGMKQMVNVDAEDGRLPKVL